MDEVQFVGIKTAYAIGSPLSVHYTSTGKYIPNPQDWVGLYRVGWTNYKEYVTYVYAINRSTNVKGYVGVVEFRNKYLPQYEDDSSYQLCYISSDKKILGVSQSFVFKSGLFEDLSKIEVDKQTFVKCNNCQKRLINDKMIEQLKSDIQDYKRNLLKVKNENISIIESKDEKILKLNSKNINLVQEITNTMREITSLKETINKLERNLSTDIKCHSAKLMSLEKEVKKANPVSQAVKSNSKAKFLMNLISRLKSDN